MLALSAPIVPANKYRKGIMRRLIAAASLFVVAVVSGTVLNSCTQKAAAPPQSNTTAGSGSATPDNTAAKENEGRETGVQAVIYGLPLVIMDITMKKSTNVARPVGNFAPANQFAHLRAFPGASFKDVVRANVDTLYSSAFLELSKEPVVLSVPDTHGRYYLLPMLGMWTNIFASPGKRTTGTKARNLVVTGPGWTGKLPAGMEELKSPTNGVWIIGRTQTNGPRDYPAVHSIQNGYKLVPLSAFGKPYTPPPGTVDPNIDMKAAPVETLQKMTSASFFDALAQLLKSNPPPASDAPILAKLATIGVVPGEKFDPSKIDPAIAKGLDGSLSVALEKLLEAAKNSGSPVNGWRIPPSILGRFGTEYGIRAIVALVGLGANLPEDAVYPTTYVDSDGKALNGANRYTLHFEKELTPPINAFWSLTMYDAQSFFVDNTINRYAISSWMPLKRNSDGSIDLYLQHDSPGEAREANWLPAAAGDFNVTLRMYWPKDKSPSIINGSWKPPAVTRVQ
jgi:hypothetical protein